MTIKGVSKATVHELMSILNQPYIKKYKVYNSDGLVASEYVAQASAVASGVCLQHVYTYTASGVNSKVVLDYWQDALWNAAWDNNL